jgi:hypothetical protein
MNHSIHRFEMPNLNISQEELTKIIYKMISQMSSSFDFNGFNNRLSSYLLDNKTGFDVEANTTYRGGMQQKDQNTVREIIWDLIISRYLTPGGNGNDAWPSLSITERGKRFFASLED